MAVLNNGTQLSLNFTVGEFAIASKRPLVDSDLPNLQTLVNTILQPARRVWGRIDITSYIRPADVGRAHEAGRAVDFVPAQATIPIVFEWLCANLPGNFGRVIDERDHIHITLPGSEPWAGRGVCLREPVEGSFEFATVAPATWLTRETWETLPLISPAPDPVTTASMLPGDIPAIAIAGALVFMLGVVLFTGGKR